MAFAVTGKKKGHVTEIYIEWLHNKARIKILKTESQQPRLLR